MTEPKLIVELKHQLLKIQLETETEINGRMFNFSKDNVKASLYDLHLHLQSLMDKGIIGAPQEATQVQEVSIAATETSTTSAVEAASPY